MSTTNDNIVYGIEKRHGVQAIESEGRGLWYLQDDERKMMGILTIINGKPSCAILKKDQVKMLIAELTDIYETVFCV